jgi:hypothetical protein
MNDIEEKIVVQKSDADLAFQILDENGAPLNLSGANKMYVLLHYGDNVLLDKFSFTTATGYKPFTSGLLDHAAGIIKVALLSSTTNTAKPGRVYAEIGIQFSDSSRTDDSIYDFLTRKGPSDQNNYVCTIVKAISPNITLP